jgi:hypothetical protein
MEGLRPGYDEGGCPTCDGLGLGVLLAEGRVAQVAKVCKAALNVQVGHQAGGRWHSVTRKAGMGSVRRR